MASSYPTSRSARAAAGRPGSGQTFEPRPSDVLTDLLGRPFRPSTEFERLLDDVYRPRDRDRSVIPSGGGKLRRRPRLRPETFMRLPLNFLRPDVWPGHNREDCGLGVPVITAGTFANPCATNAGVIFGFPDAFLPLGGPAGDLGFNDWYWSGVLGGLPLATATVRHVWVGPELAPTPLDAVGGEPLPVHVEETGDDPRRLPILYPVVQIGPRPWDEGQVLAPPWVPPADKPPAEASERGYERRPTPQPGELEDPELVRPVTQPLVTEKPVQVYPQTQVKPELQPEHMLARAEPGTHERKVGTRHSRVILALINAVTEGCDAVDAIYAALPKNRRGLICGPQVSTYAMSRGAAVVETRQRPGGGTRRGPFSRERPGRNSPRCRRPTCAEKAERIWRYADELDVAMAVRNMAIQGLGDVAQFNVGKKDYNKLPSWARPHGNRRIGFEVGPAL